MQNLTPRCWHALCAIFLLFTGALTAQVKTGFDLLDKKDYKGAIEAFSEVPNSPEDAAAAAWGLSRAFAAADNPMQNLDSSFVLADGASKLLKKVKSKRDKKRLAKRYDLNPSAITALTKTMPKDRWAQIDGKGSLRDLDRYMRVFKTKMPPDVKKKAAPQQRTALRNAVANYRSYEDQAYLYKTHNKLLRDSFAKQYSRIEDGLFEQFLSERDHHPDSVEVFMAALPSHPVSSKNKTSYDAFVKARTANTLMSYFKFLEQYIDAPFASIALRQVERLSKTTPLSPEDRKRLTPDQLSLYDDIASGQGVQAVVTCTSEYEGKGVETWKRYMQRHAGDRCGARALHEVVQYLFAQRDWATASAILREIGPLYPADSTWNRKMLAISDAPSSGFKPKSLGPKVNTSGSESFPALSPDGLTLAFCGKNRKDNIGGEDIYFTTLVDSAWTEAKIVRDLSGSGNDAINCFTDDGNTVLLFGGSSVYISKRTSSGWTPKKNYDMSLGSFSYVGDVVVASGGRQAIIAGRSGSGTGTDLHISFLGEDNTWSKPEKIKGNINTASDERSPYIHPDMRTLYFSSECEGGFGGYDVYRTVRLDDTWLNWSEPVNLGKDINGSGNDWGYVINNEGTLAYFSSGEFGSADLYSIQLPKEARPELEVRSIKVVVVDEKGKPLTDMPLEVRNSLTGKIVADSRTSPTTGMVTLTLPAGDRVAFTTNKTGWFSDPVALDLAMPLPDSLKKKPLRVLARKVEELKDQKTVLNSDVLFDTGKWDLKPEATGQIQIIANFINREKRTLTLTGHTDVTGGNDDNKVLSEKRANAVKEALVAAGVPADKITAIGAGESQTVCSENTPDCHQRNRRVEIKW
jgi:outer membrane protein OmpA-like peptidoglycan-associated protein